MLQNRDRSDFLGINWQLYYLLLLKLVHISSKYQGIPVIFQMSLDLRQKVYTKIHPERKPDVKSIGLILIAVMNYSYDKYLKEYVNSQLFCHIF